LNIGAGEDDDSRGWGKNKRRGAEQRGLCPSLEG